MKNEATTAAATEHSAGAVNEGGMKNEATTAAATIQGDQDDQGRKGNLGEDDAATEDAEAEVQRHNATATDRLMEENGVRYPRLASRPDTAHKRAR